VAEVWHLLSPCQQEAVAFACVGMDDSAIAIEMGTSLSTVRTHIFLSRIKLSLQGKSPRMLIAWYYLKGPGCKA